MAVDLAPRYSGAVRLDEAGNAVDQWSSWRMDEDRFIASITEPFVWGDDPIPELLVVEDIPHGLKFMGNVRQVCRIQGRIVERMAAAGLEDRIVFYPPDLWQRPMGVWKKGLEAIPLRAKELGYEPPDLVEPGMKYGPKTTARKAMTDFCAAFLMGRQAQQFHVEQGSVDVHLSSRYKAWTV